MTKSTSQSSFRGKWTLFFLILSILPVIAFSQTVFSFNVDNLESFNRVGNWVYDVDSPGLPTQDGNWFSFGPLPQYHFYADINVAPQATPGHVTNITCIAENTDVAANPAQISLVFTAPFQLSTFSRVNTVNEALPWNAIGQAGDKRTYANATGYIALDNIPKLYFSNLTFVITTPYPTQAQIRNLSPAFTTWLGDIGTGTAQTGYGFGEVDVLASDPAWAALYASSDYKVDMPMVGITSEMSISKSWFDFVLNFDLGDLTTGTGNGVAFDKDVLPANLDYPEQNTEVDIIGGTNNTAGITQHYFYVNEVPVTPVGALPLGLNSQTKKYWKIGTTLDTFNADISFTVNPGDFVAAKGSADWVLLHRPAGGAWTAYPAFAPVDATTIKATGVTETYVNHEFTIASTVDETLPVTLSSFTANVSSQNLISLAWSTASETSMIGFKVYYKPAASENPMVCISPIVIPAENSSNGANYSFVAQDISAPGVYYFWLEAISIDGSSTFYGPVNATLTETEVPALPVRNNLSDAWPNPFNFGNATSIRVEMKAGETGTVAIYNLAGQTVQTYTVNQGISNLSWNGMDNKGNQCSSGVYFFKLSSPSLSQTKKLMLVK